MPPDFELLKESINERAQETLEQHLAEKLETKVSNGTNLHRRTVSSS